MHNLVLTTRNMRDLAGLPVALANPWDMGGRTGAFAAVMDPSNGPALREVLARLAAVPDETSEDVLI